MSPFTFDKTEYSDYRHAYVDCVSSKVMLCHSDFPFPFLAVLFSISAGAYCLQLSHDFNVSTGKEFGEGPSPFYEFFVLFSNPSFKTACR